MEKLISLMTNKLWSLFTTLGHLYVRVYSVETTYGINSVVSKLMIIVEITETGQSLFLTMLILSYFPCS
jgi:hypothetical protein